MNGKFELTVVIGFVIIVIVSLFRLYSDKHDKSATQQQHSQQIAQIQTDYDRLVATKPTYIAADTNCHQVINEMYAALKNAAPASLLMEVEARYTHYKDVSAKFDKLLESNKSTAELIEQAENVRQAQGELQAAVHKDEALANFPQIQENIGKMDVAIMRSEEALNQWVDARQRYNKNSDLITSLKLESRFPKKI